MSRFRFALAALCLTTAWTSSCRTPRGADGSAVEPGTDTPGTSAQSPEAGSATRQPGALATVPAAPVEFWTGPGKRPFDVAARTSEREAGHTRAFGSITLQTALRARPVGQYPCTSCHLGRKVVMADQRIADAHDDIQPVHPAEAGAVCSTCHAADNVALLPLKEGDVNVEYMYGLVGTSSGKVVMIFHFRDSDRAMEILRANGVRILDSKAFWVAEQTP